MITLQIEQQTPEWEAARAGIPTASCFDKIVTTKGAASKSAEKYMNKLAGERITQTRDATYSNGAMERGSELEGEAREFYEMVNDCEIAKVGLCFPDEDRKYACSPDGLVGEDGLIEIKCPLMATHVGYLRSGELPSEYIQQVQGQLLVTGRKWLDFISYYPGLKPLIVRVERDEVFISKLSFELEAFCAELEQVVEKIK